MGLLIDGRWKNEGYDTASTGGRFVRSESQFRHRIGEPDFPAEAGRYHLYVSLACPWAHRTVIFRRLKGLEKSIPLHIVHPHMLDQGWRFDPVDRLYGDEYLHRIYARAEAHYTGRVTVPVLWDAGRQTIVNNESAEIVRMFNSAFDALTGNPEELRGEIDAVNAFVYERVNNGVYLCGFATTQQAYEEAYDALFAALDELEARLSRQRYLVGERITEADWRLFTTLIRFDAVYYGHFKCNRKRIVDMPGLWGWLRELYQYPGIAETVDFRHIKQHYYRSHTTINPTGIVPKGPEFDLDVPHDRGGGV